MKRRLARALVRLYPRNWRARYGAEFEALLEEGPGAFGTALNVMISALGERVSPTTGDEVTAATSRMETWTQRAPWAVFGVAPICVLAAAYCVCLFVLWSGWAMLLPSENTPFVPVTGWALVYFGAGRFLYFFAPLLVCCAIAWVAAGRKVKALWPVLGMVMIAVIGAAVQVKVSRGSPNEPGHVGMSLAFWHPEFSAEMLLVSVLIYLLLRMRRSRMRPV